MTVHGGLLGSAAINGLSFKLGCRDLLLQVFCSASAALAFVVENRLAVGVEHPLGIAFTILALFSLVRGTVLFERFAPAGRLWVRNGVQSLSAGFALLPFAFSFESFGDVVPTWRLFAALA